MSTDDETGRESSGDASSRRHGLPQLATHVGAPTFFTRMLGRAQQRTGLEHLNVYAEEEPTVALVDACAAVLDTVSFYQERIANESYVRTATDLRSATELARTVGYEPSGGIASTTVLCFTVDDAPTSARRVPIPKGTRAHSVPGPSETARFFETVESFEARPEWNGMRPIGRQPQDLLIDAQGRLVLAGLDGHVGAPVASLTFAGTSAAVRRGDVVACVDGARSASATVLGVEVDFDRGVTRVRVDSTLADHPPALPPPLSLAVPSTGTAPAAKRSLDLDYVRDAIIGRIWDEASLSAVIEAQGWDEREVVESVGKVLAQRERGRADVVGFTQRAAFFGHAAPSSASIADASTDWDANGGRTVWVAADGTSNAQQGVSVHLERVVPEASLGSIALFEDRNASGVAVRRAFRITANRERTLVGFGQQARVSGLALARVDGSPLSASDRDPVFRFRTATAYVASQALTLAPLPVVDVVEEKAATPRGAKAIVLDRMVLGLTKGRAVIVRGAEPGIEASVRGADRAEVVRLAAVRHVGGRTTLYFDRNLQYRYVRETLRISANVATATHGETISNEILGGGSTDPGRQSFVLSRPDLTHVRSETASGGSAALEVRVDDEAWTRVESFADATPTARVFTTRRDDEGRTVLTFGDGRRGMRPPTNEASVSATYRSGIGVAGNVAARTITIPVSRPLGLREVENPLPAAGGADPATAREIRENAPRSTTTLGRAISLRDFEDFALAYEGVARARAEAVWTGRSQIAFVTVAGPNGAEVPRDGVVQVALEKALERSSDGLQSVRVGSFERKLFAVDVLVWVAPGHELAIVEQSLRASLAAAFGFEARGLARPVTQAEVLTAAQSVRGVVGAMISRFAIVGHAASATSAPPPLLPARGARWDQTTRRVIAADLLLIDLNGSKLTLKTSNP